MKSESINHDSLKLWLKLLRTTVGIEDEIRRRLRQQFNTTLPRFDVLSQLYRYPEGLTMSAVSKHLMVTKGNLTGITDQLESDAWIKRSSHAQDRRSTVLRLTALGKKEFEAMARVHEGWVVELLSPLSQTQQDQMTKLLAKIN